MAKTLTIPGYAVCGTLLMHLRLFKVWSMLHEHLVCKQKVIVQQLSDNCRQADQIYHFLNNPRVTHAELINMNCSVKPEVLSGRHVLLIGDSTSFNLSEHQGRIQDKDSIGVLNDGKTLGFLSHIHLALDADKDSCAGPSRYLILFTP